jgi:hypothetical protein
MISLLLLKIYLQARTLKPKSYDSGISTYIKIEMHLSI